MPITHPFISAKPSNPDASLVDGPKWNQAHVFSGGVNGQSLVYDAATADKFSWITEPYINVKAAPFYAKGDGVADDTAAIQAALNVYSNQTGKSAALWFPAGTYRISSMLTVVGNNTGSLSMEGFPRFSHPTSGAKLQWVGASNGTLIQFKGVNFTRISGLVFSSQSGMLKATEFLTNQYAGGAGTYSVYISNCYFTGLLGASSVALRIGDGASFQVSEFFVDSCNFSGNGVDSGKAILGGVGNAKNYYYKNSTFAGWDVGIAGEFGNGAMVIDSCIFGSNRTSDIKDLAVGQVEVKSCETENSNAFFKSSGVSSSLHLHSNTVFLNNTDGTDIAVECEAMAHIHNNHFYNFRTANSSCRFKILDPTATFHPQSFHFYNNILINAATTPGFPEIYDGSGNYLPSLYAHDKRTHLNAINMYCYSNIRSNPDGTGLAEIKDFILKTPNIYALAPTQQGFGVYSPYLTELNIGELSTAKYVFTLSYLYWNAAATAQNLVLVFPPKTRFKDVTLDTTVPYAGLAGTISLSAGDSTVAGNFILSHDVKTATVRKGGDVNADYGAALASQYHGWIPNWSSDCFFQLRLVSGTGNLGNGTATNLTAGSTTVYISYEILA